LSRKPSREPSDVCAEKGAVVVDGPDGVAVSLTPDAAEETSERLHVASIEARGQEMDLLRSAPDTRDR
jgi:hypothetical protein